MVRLLVLLYSSPVWRSNRVLQDNSTYFIRYWMAPFWTNPPTGAGVRSTAIQAYTGVAVQDILQYLYGYGKKALLKSTPVGGVQAVKN